MSYLQKVQEGIDEFRQEVHDGELTSLEIASWLFYQRKLEPAAKSQIQLLAKDVSRAMSTQTFIDARGRRVRKKLCLRKKMTRPDGSVYFQPTWFDNDIATSQFKALVFAQRRDAVGNILWQLKQDIDHHNEFDNPGQPYQTTFNFEPDMADHQAGLDVINEVVVDDGEVYDEESDPFDQRLAAAD